MYKHSKIYIFILNIKLYYILVIIYWLQSAAGECGWRFPCSCSPNCTLFLLLWSRSAMSSCLLRTQRHKTTLRSRFCRGEILFILKNMWYSNRKPANIFSQLIFNNRFIYVHIECEYLHWSCWIVVKIISLTVALRLHTESLVVWLAAFLIAGTVCVPVTPQTRCRDSMHRTNSRFSCKLRTPVKAWKKHHSKA